MITGSDELTDPLVPFRENVLSYAKRAGIVSPILTTPPIEFGDISISDVRDIETARKILDSFVAGDVLSRVSVVSMPNPFVNFHVNTKTLAELTLNMVQTRKEKYGWQNPNGKHVIVEHTSANPTGPLHVGRARNSIVGDAVVRLLKASGYDVETHYYVNDLGLQSAILSWGVSHSQTYQNAHASFTNQSQIKEEIYQLMLAAERGETESISSACNLVIESSLRFIGITFDKFIWESSFLKDGSVFRVVANLKSSNLASQQDESWQLDLSDPKYNIHGTETKMVFLRKNGSTLYITRDIAYHLSKFASSDIVVNILGEDHKHEAHLLSIALNIIGEKRSPTVLFYSFVTLADGKMSTRKGNSVLFDDLVNEAIIRAKKIVDEKRSSLDEMRKNEIARAIGIGAVRYNILRIHPAKPIVFRWEDALNFDGSSAPFLQYAHVRCCSILKNRELKSANLNLLSTQHERNLIWKIASFPSEVQDATIHYKPHIIPTFAHSLGSTFNTFYEKLPVLKAETEELQNSRLVLIDATRIALANALQLMGIEPLEEM